MKHFLCMIFIFLLHAPASAIGKKAVDNEFSKESLLIELTGKDDDAMTDVELYSEIVAAYQARDEIGLKARLQKFMQKHPKSSFADNALYLAGRHSLEHNDYAGALKFFQRITADYPHSNRVVSAQFAKAMAYKKMNLSPQARKVLREIVKKYPGSPESFRADSEMRLLN